MPATPVEQTSDPQDWPRAAQAGRHSTIRTSFATAMRIEYLAASRFARRGAGWPGRPLGYTATHSARPSFLVRAPPQRHLVDQAQLAAEPVSDRQADS